MNDLQFFYSNALIDSRAAPFSETEILLEEDLLVREAMLYIVGLLGLKQLGKCKEHLESNETESTLLGKVLARLCVAKKLNRSQCIALINQLFQ